MQRVAGPGNGVGDENDPHGRRFLAPLAAFGVAVLHRRSALHDPVAVRQRLDRFVHRFGRIGRAFHRRAGDQLRGYELKRLLVEHVTV